MVHLGVCDRCFGPNMGGIFSSSSGDPCDCESASCTVPAHPPPPATTTTTPLTTPLTTPPSPHLSDPPLYSLSILMWFPTDKSIQLSMQYYFTVLHWGACGDSLLHPSQVPQSGGADAGGVFLCQYQIHRRPPSPGGRGRRGGARHFYRHLDSTYFIFWQGIGHNYVEGG